MNKLFFSLFFLIASAACSAQNLVPNPSFEQYNSCPDALAQIYMCENWSTYGGTPDYYNNCSANMGFVNPAGFQDANTGEAYGGLSTFSSPPPNYREYLGTQLNSTMEVGTTYYISFYINKANGNTIGNVKNCANNVGVLFSTISYDSLTPPPLSNFAHINVDTIITDTLNWNIITGEFVADSAYEYITIGNFFDDNNTDILFTPDPFNYRHAYYYIDDVCVSKSIVECGIVGVAKLEISPTDLFPNPVNQLCYLQYQYPIRDIVIINYLGEIIKPTIIMSTEALLEFDFSNLNNGIYFLKFLENEKYHVIKFIKP